MEEEIAAAAKTTHQQTRAKADATEKATDRAKGERKVFGPKDALERFEEAVELCVQKFALAGEPISFGEARARVGEWFYDRWADEIRRREWRGRQMFALGRPGTVRGWTADGPSDGGIDAASAAS